jgi:hypothetical protein
MNSPQHSGSPQSPTIIQEMIDLLGFGVQAIFANILDAHVASHQANHEILPAVEYKTLKSCLENLQAFQNQLPDSKLIDLLFMLGRESYDSRQVYVPGLESYESGQISQFENALTYYKESLSLWQKLTHQNNSNTANTIYNLTPLEKTAAIFSQIALCYQRLGKMTYPPENHRYWQLSEKSWDESLNTFAEAGRNDLVAKFIGEKCTVLQHLQQWEDLHSLAQKSLELHITYGSEEQLALDYGFLAEAAMHQSKWAHANQLAELALAIKTQSISDPLESNGEMSSYLSLLAESQQELEQWRKIVGQLEDARQKTDPTKDLSSYLQVLKALHKLYLEQDHYVEAAQVKEEQVKLEYANAQLAFLGINHINAPSGNSDSIVAKEISIAGRLPDAENIVERIKSETHRLVIIHGRPGVGKTSLLNGGLLPLLLQPNLLENTTVLPIILRIYTDWLREPDPNTWNLTSVLENLRRNDDPSYLKVLIFDQFQEFFIVCQDLKQRLPFYQFLHDCLSLKSVKVILSMQTDFLHYLLECDRLTGMEKVINYEILSKQVLYYIGHFSPTQAQDFIKKATETANLLLPNNLIEQIVNDLSQENQEVLPIALQIIGAQLQHEHINTLKQYVQIGDNPQEILEQRFLDTMIKDCGDKNERTAVLVLYLLTNEKGQRPLKTKAQLALDLLTESTKLDVVLDVLVADGLVLLLPDVPDDRYQLAHDYLVKLIRQQQGERLIAELQLERDMAQKKLMQEKPNSFIDKAIASVFRWMRAD